MTRYSILADAVVSYRGMLFLADVDEFPGVEALQEAWYSAAQASESSGMEAIQQAWRALAIAEEPSGGLPPIPILLDRDGPRLDYLGTANFAGAHICSQRFIDLLASYSAPGLLLPAQLYDRATGEPIPQQAFMWRPILLRNAVDWERSEYVVNRLLSQRQIWEIALTEECLQANLPIFEADKQFEYLVRDDVRASMEAAGITGVEFRPLTMPRERHLFVELGGDPSMLRPYKRKRKR